MRTVGAVKFGNRWESLALWVEAPLGPVAKVTKGRRKSENGRDRTQRADGEPHTPATFYKTDDGAGHLAKKSLSEPTLRWTASPLHQKGPVLPYPPRPPPGPRGHWGAYSSRPPLGLTRPAPEPPNSKAAVTCAGGAALLWAGRRQSCGVEAVTQSRVHLQVLAVDRMMALTL